MLRLRIRFVGHLGDDGPSEAGDRGIVDEALSGEEALHGGRVGTKGPVGQSRPREQLVPGSGIAGLEVGGGIPGDAGAVRMRHNAEETSEVAGVERGDVRRAAAGPYGADAGSDVTGPERERARGVRGRDGLAYELRPAGVRVHGLVREASAEIGGRPRARETSGKQRMSSGRASTVLWLK